MMQRLATIALVLVAGTAFAQEPMGDPSIIPVGAKLEVLFDGAFFSEGPAVAPDGSVFFSDITFSKPSGMQAGHIWRYDPQTGTTADLPLAQRHVQRPQVRRDGPADHR